MCTHSPNINLYHCFRFVKIITIVVTNWFIEKCMSASKRLFWQIENIFPQNKFYIFQSMPVLDADEAGVNLQDYH